MVEVTSWIPHAVVETLRDRSAQPVIAWLTAIRGSIEEYDPLVLVRPASVVSHASESDGAFDEILSQLGKEIYKLDEYQRHLSPQQPNVSHSILNIFDECLESINVRDKETMPNIQPKQNSVNSDSTLTQSDVPFATSTPSKSASAMENRVVEIVPPIPSRRKIKAASITSSNYDNVDFKDTIIKMESDSDSESTCWSYKECNPGEVNKDTYAVVWSHSSGYHNSDEILLRVLSQVEQHATISRLSFDTASDFTPPPFSVYALHEVEDRCASVAAMTPDKPCDDGYEPVRDALTDENIYEEIEYGYSYTDEGCSCGGSVDVESLVSASSEGVGRDSPLYANLRDNDAYAIPPDVIFWKNQLLDPFCNEDEEDEWITPEECEVYTRERRPPLVIPRITQYRPPRRDQRIHYPEESLKDVPAKSWNWSPTSERSRLDLERSFSKANSDSPPLWVSKRLGGSTENLLARRPNHLQLPPSSSGDSLDVEVRERAPGKKERKSRSMVAPKQKRAPVSSPRLMHVPIEATVLYEGPIKRTKFFEGGKKSKKNWTDCYMILTPTALVFYKDQRTYYATKLPKPMNAPPSPTAPRAELVLPLLNAHVVQCIQMHTRRHTRSLVLTVEHDQYLIQDESEDSAKRLLKCIQNVIYKLGPPVLDDRPSPQYQSSNTDLESLGRTPPVSRHATRKQKDEPVFGRKLEEVCPSTSPRVPDFVRACVKEIESSEENMCTDGLYRASGNLSQVQKIRLEIDQNNLSVIENNTDIHVLTGSLKLFFRELKEPLIPCTMFDRVLAACSIKPREARVKEFRDIVQSLPQCNRDTLKFLLEHLLKVTQYSERNRMHTANLAIVFGPTLLWAPEEQAHRIAIDCIQQNNVVDILLNEYKDIFAEDTKGKKKA
ncbi:rho GTPase-activating protein 27-like isoform X2 [Colias croceus]|uniref:rho GTPase-activating protein 27-like isoform X2 n=1 Tax=Colias crocea TaxID=72248 RepID=UPI001E281543|nr:rho GTPase-activating protein 27-like isoform X2 [Colias croceus]